MSVKDYSNVRETYKYFIRKIYERVNDIKGVRTIVPDKIDYYDEEEYTRLTCNKCIIS